MEHDYWIEETLRPTLQAVEQTTKAIGDKSIPFQGDEAFEQLLKEIPDKSTAVGTYVKKEIYGILRILRPVCRRLTPEEATETSQKMNTLGSVGMVQGTVYLVRIGMEFDIPEIRREEDWNYTSAWCNVYLYSPKSGVQPRVLEIYPKRLYEGKPDTVSLGFGLGVETSGIKADIAKVGWEGQIGNVTPVTLGFFGDQEQYPYWEMRKKQTPIRGSYHFWMMVERPPECPPIRLKVMGEGNLQTHWLTIPVGPEMRAWETRQCVEIEDDGQIRQVV